MRLEYKTVGVASVQKVEDEGDGIVTAFVSVTGLKDNVNDIIEPGAYLDTLTTRMPKGVWGHQWLQPTSKTLEAVELMPGDSRLPSTLANGDPWPPEAGALRIKMRFNLNTQRGRDAYEDVIFFGDQQEWSIGYLVPDGGAVIDKKTGVRRIKKLDLFEYSPVLFGAMPMARTSSVKVAQLAMKTLLGEDVEPWERRITEFKTAIEVNRRERADAMVDDFDADDDGFDGEDETDEKMGAYAPPSRKPRRRMADDDDDDDDDEEDPGDMTDRRRRPGGKLNPDTIRTAIKALESVLTDLGVEVGSELDGEETAAIGLTAFVEAKATEYDTVKAAVDALDGAFDKSDVQALQAAAAALDDAYASDDLDGVEAASSDVLDVLERVFEDEPTDGARVLSRMIADRIEELASDGRPDPGNDEKSWRDDDTTYKIVPFGSRRFGMPTRDGGIVHSAASYIAALDDGALLALDAYLDDLPGHNGMKSAVLREADTRDLRRPDGKMGGWSGAGSRGQRGRGGGRHRRAAEGRTPRNAGRRRNHVAAVRARPTGHDEEQISSGEARNKGWYDAIEEKREFSPEKLATLGDRGMAFKNSNGDWSYPVETVGDLENAITAYGRCKSDDRDRLKAYLKQRARTLKREDLIPARWHGAEKTETVDLAELKSLEEFLVTLR